MVEAKPCTWKLLHVVYSVKSMMCDLFKGIFCIWSVVLQHRFVRLFSVSKLEFLKFFFSINSELILTKIWRVKECYSPSGIICVSLDNYMCGKLSHQWNQYVTSLQVIVRIAIFAACKLLLFVQHAHYDLPDMRDREMALWPSQWKHRPSKMAFIKTPYNGVLVFEEHHWHWKDILHI